MRQVNYTTVTVALIVRKPIVLPAKSTSIISLHAVADAGGLHVNLIVIVVDSPGASRACPAETLNDVPVSDAIRVPDLVPTFFAVMVPTTCGQSSTPFVCVTATEVLSKERSKNEGVGDEGSGEAPGQPYKKMVSNKQKITLIGKKFGFINNILNPPLKS